MIATDYELRRCKPEDKAFLYHLLQATLRPYVEQIGYWDERSQREQFERRFVPDWTRIIQVEGVDMGCLVLEKGDADWHLAEIQILPTFQNRGIGTTILMELMAQAAACNVALTLQVLKNNPARRLYERLGFEQTSRSYWHYHFRWE